MRQTGSVLMIILFMSLSLVVFLLGYVISNKNYSENKPRPSTPLTSTTKVPSHSFNPKCVYSILSNDEYLNVYTVKKGDNLLALSGRFLGSSARVNEIVTLNEQRYSNLLNNLEAGWTIYLPPKFAYPSSGNIWGYSGEILNETTTYWNFRTVNIESAPLDYKLYKDTKTVYFGKTAFHTGDCVKVIIDGADQKVIAISPQDTADNYFLNEKE